MNPMIIQAIAQKAGAATGAAMPAVASALVPGGAVEKKDYRELRDRVKSGRLGLDTSEQRAIQQQALAPVRSAISGQLAAAGDSLTPAQQSQLMASQNAALAKASAVGASEAARQSLDVAAAQRNEFFKRLEARRAKAAQTAGSITSAIATPSSGGGENGGMGFSDILSSFGGGS